MLDHTYFFSQVKVSCLFMYLPSITIDMATVDNPRTTRGRLRFGRHFYKILLVIIRVIVSLVYVQVVALFLKNLGAVGCFKFISEQFFNDQGGIQSVRASGKSDLNKIYTTAAAYLSARGKWDTAAWQNLE